MNTPLRRLVRWANPARLWRQRLRNIDHKILFPQIRKLAKGEFVASLAIKIHCAHDSAWRCDPAEFSKQDREILP